MNKYNINIIDNFNKTNYFIEYLTKFYDNKKKNKYVSIDFEYTQNKIKLWQVCFYNKKKKDIFVIMERFINEDNMKIIIKKLLTSKIIKIFHGAESLDFPYLIKVLKKEKKIYKFLKYSFDTKFFCEYYKTLHQEKKICNIYDAMLSFNILNKEKYDDLNKMNERMGPIWKVNWDNVIKNNDLLTYTVYDVIYLKELLIKIYDIFKQENLKDDFYNLQKINTYVILIRNNINYNYKPSIENIGKYKVIDYYKNIL